MEQITELKFQRMTSKEMKDIWGGKPFGHVDTPIEGTNCVNDVAGCTQEWLETTYFFWIKVGSKTKTGGCSYGKGSSTCASCTMCS